MIEAKGQYRIVETPCFPNSWKVVPVQGRNSNATFLYHPTQASAKDQIEQQFNGILLETIFLEN
jgi:hypothetical protein